VGVLTACVLFARRVAHVVTLTSTLSDSGLERIYEVHGQLFFASSNDLVDHFEYTTDPVGIVIDMADAHIWDASSVAALDAITTPIRPQGKARDHHRHERPQPGPA
jgi:SulP family sulfate permease